MKKALFIAALFMAFVPGALRAQTMGGPVPSDRAQAEEARMNRDGYPYFVMNKPILPREEKDKIRRHIQRLEANEKAREQSIRAQFRAMSADERRHVIEQHGFPEAVQPGFK